MKYKFLQGGISLFLLITIILLSPFGARAQSAPKFQTLTVSLWPEYDRPDVLVLYRGQLSADTELPVQLTFRLPGYVDKMHAVAAQRNNGILADIPHELSREGDEVLLTFSAPSPNIQFEYYDPVILNKQEQTRRFTFDFSAPYDIEMALFEVQQPIETEDFSLVPAADNTSPGDDGLVYSTVGSPNLASGNPFRVSVTYRRNTSELSVSRGQASGLPVNIPEAIESSSSNNNLIIIYALIAAGVVLALYWWREIMRRSAPQSGGRGRARLKNSQAGRSKRSRTAESTGLFCYNCGATLQDDANFCHACGAERR